MASKVALVTGTNSGIGLAIAVQMCQAGYTTYATVRSLEKADGLRKAATDAGVVDRLKVMEMDVGNDASVSTAVQALLAETGNVIDLVVSNAGFFDSSPPEAMTVDALAASLNVNLFGAVRLSNAVLPAMRAAGRGRFIATSSLAGLLGMPTVPAYVSSKFALEGYMESMAATYAGVGIHFSIVEPGPVKSGLLGNAIGASGAPAELRPAVDTYGQWLDGLFTDAQTPDECAKYFLQAATDARPQLRYMTYPTIAPLLREKFTDLTGKGTLEALQSMVAPRAEVP